VSVWLGSRLRAAGLGACLRRVGQACTSRALMACVDVGRCRAFALGGMGAPNFYKQARSLIMPGFTAGQQCRT